MLCSSYSGNTEETIACYEAAEALGAPRIVATTGGQLADSARRDGVPVIGLPAGLQPRAAVGYTFTVAAEVAALVGAAPGIRTEIDSSAAHLREAGNRLAELAAELAERLEGSFPVIYGADLTTPVAVRWKTQINENAKLPAFASALPEADHNEIVGWGGARESGRLSAVFLEDRDQHPRVRQRFELTAKLIEPDVDGRRPLGDRGREPRRAAALGGDARRPVVAPPRRPPGNRPHPDRGDRPAEEGARPPGIETRGQLTPS